MKHRIQKGTAWLLVCTLMLSLFPLTGITVAAQTITGISDFTGYTEISTKEQLSAIRNDLDGKYVLTEDIVFTEDDFAVGGSFYNGGAGWEPIGASEVTAFSGVFDGNGYSIQNLKVNITTTASEQVYAGLFGFVKYGTVNNLSMLNADITVNVAGEQAHAGAIAGQAYTCAISNCRVSGTVSATAENFVCAGGLAGAAGGCEIIACYNTAAVNAVSTVPSSDNAWAGGIAGNGYATVSNCYNTGNVTATAGSYAGAAGIHGVAGLSDEGPITNCYNTGEISATVTVTDAIATAAAGGIAATSRYNGAVITGCYNLGHVISSAPVNRNADSYAGGILGKWDSFTAAPSSTIVSCYYVNTVSQGVGSGTDAAVCCTREQMQQQETFAGFDFDTVWAMGQGVEYPYPELLALPNLTGYTEISTKEQLYAIRDNLDGKYVLTENIVFTAEDFATGGAFYNGGAGWQPIGEDYDHAFTGIFDGNKHTITGLQMDVSTSGSVYAGLFGYVNGGQIRNLGMVASHIEAQSTASSHQDRACAGGIAGYVRGGSCILGCYNTGSVMVRASCNAAAGGIVGDAENTTVANCGNTGTITVNSAADAYTSYYPSAGGIVGFTDYGDLTVTDCYNAGSVGAQGACNAYAGGMVGSVEYGELTAIGCSNTGAVTARSTVRDVYAGGMAGYAYTNSVITDCDNAGDIAVISEGEAGVSWVDAGGMVGYVHTDSVIIDCNNTGDITAQTVTFACIGGIAGEAEATAFSACNNTGTVSVTDAQGDVYVSAGGIVGQASNAGEIGSELLNCCNTGSVTATLPTTAGAAHVGGVTGLANPATALTDCRNAGSITVTGYDANVGGMIGTHEATSWGPVTVTDCGNTGAVQVKTAQKAYAGGMVGCWKSLDASNVTITGCCNTGSITSSGYAGGIAGDTFATISQCYNTAAITAEASARDAYAGGIVAMVRGPVSACYNTGKVTGTSTADDVYVGGIAGHTGSSNATVTDCYNAANLYGASGATSSKREVCVGGILGYSFSANIAHCYHIGHIGADHASSADSAFVGGIVGRVYKNQDCTVTDCYFSDAIANGVGSATDVFGTAVGAADATACTFAQMQQQATFAGFDFDTVWTMQGDEAYLLPELQLPEMVMDQVRPLFMQWQTLPTKTEYLEAKDQLDVSGGSFTVYYNDGSDDTLNVTPEMVVGFDNTVVGPQTLTVTYGYQTLTFDVEIIAKTLTSIAVTSKPNKLNYMVGEEFDESGMIVTAYYNNDTQQMVLDYAVGGYQSTYGTKIIEVLYQGKFDTFKVWVNKYTPDVPEAPTLFGKTSTTVTLTPHPGYQYSKNGEEWQTSNVFTGLQADTQYDFYQRVGETDSAFASESSESLVVITDAGAPSSTTSSTHTVSGSTISKITAGATVDSVLDGLSAGEYCKVFKGTAEVSGSAKIGTGMVVKIMDGDEVKASYTVIVTGDTNGDGDISITDMLSIKAHVLSKTPLSGAYSKAADTSGDGGVTITDFIQLKAKILGKGNIVAR